MAVIDGQKVNAAVSNAAFMSRTTDTNTTGVVDLDNTSDANSGAQVTNAQQAINENFDTSGTFLGDANNKTYATNNVIGDGDSQKTAIEKFDVQVQQNADDILDRIEGPASATDNAVVRYDGVSGKLAKDSGVIIDASNNITGVNDLTMSGELNISNVNKINVTETEIADPNITLNNGGNDASSEGSGITVERTGTDGSIVYEDALASKFKIGALAAEVEVADVSSTQTLTNKTIAAASNTISGLSHGTEVDNPSSGVHGVTGSIVGTTDAQTLTNKTIDADNNTISNLAHGAEVDNPSSGVHGVTGSVVGTTDTQTLTNKTLTSPDVNGADVDFGTASNTNRLVLAHDTTTNLNALTDTQGLLAYDDTLDAPVYNDGTAWVEFGGGAGDPVFVVAQDDSGQTISGGLSDVSWNTEEHDSDTAFDGTTFTVPSGKDGTYYAAAQIQSNTSATANNQELEIRILVNGTSKARARHSARSGASVNTVAVFWEDDLVATDTIKVQATSNIGASTTMASLDISNHFIIHKVK